MTSPLLAPADNELARLETASLAIASNLVDLDDNPARKDLDKGPLTGATAAAWTDATEALTQLWEGYRMLTELIGRARSLRDQRRLTDADRTQFRHLVLGESITLSTTTVPLAQRGLLGQRQKTLTCTPAELLSAMEAAFATAVGVVTRAADVWQRLLAEAASAAAALANVRQLGGRSVPLDQADQRLGTFTAALASDPLGVDERDLAAARTLIARADAERTSATELRDSLTKRLADARDLARQLTEAAGAAAVAESNAAGRFADAAIAVVTGPDLRPELAAIEALGAAGLWSLISPRLYDWTRTAQDRLTRLREATAANSGLLTTRNELRGRLDAYRAKALSRGLGEDSDLTPLAEAARTALFTAPCDVSAARAAVNAYTDALTQAIGRRAL